MKFINGTLSLLLSMMFLQCSQPEYSITTPSENEQEKITEIGSGISAELLKSLKNELQLAIKEGGFENAIKVCNLKAIPVTEIVAANTEHAVEIKRTTYQFRNPANQPNRAEKEALDFYLNNFEKNKPLPESYTQKVMENGETQYYYYKPLKMDDLCLMCHGKTENIPPEILAKINELYPNDNATGYESGDFRGLVSIKMMGL
jgi:hypothetical protein